MRKLFIPFAVVFALLLAGCASDQTEGGSDLRHVACHPKFEVHLTTDDGYYHQVCEFTEGDRTCWLAYEENSGGLTCWKTPARKDEGFKDPSLTP